MYTSLATQQNNCRSKNMLCYGIMKIPFSKRQQCETFPGLTLLSYCIKGHIYFNQDRQDLRFEELCKKYRCWTGDN